MSAKQKVQRDKSARLQQLCLLNPPELPPDRMPVSNKSNEYLRMHRRKQEEKDRRLKMTITRGKNEQEYECLIRMGEANEIMTKMGKDSSYRAYKSDDALKIHVFDAGDFSQELSVDEFNRVYQSLKNQQQKAVKPKPVKGERLNTAPAESKSTGKKTVELRKVLLETMMLTNVLNDQLALLNRKNINGFYQADSTRRV